MVSWCDVPEQRSAAGVAESEARSGERRFGAGYDVGDQADPSRDSSRNYAEFVGLPREDADCSTAPSGHPDDVERWWPKHSRRGSGRDVRNGGRSAATTASIAVARCPRQFEADGAWPGNRVERHHRRQDCRARTQDEVAARTRLLTHARPGSGDLGRSGSLVLLTPTAHHELKGSGGLGDTDPTKRSARRSDEPTLQAISTIR